MKEDCCRAPIGGDRKFLDALDVALTELETRGADQLIMDLTVITKRSMYERLVAVSDRISRLMEK